MNAKFSGKDFSRGIEIVRTAALSGSEILRRDAELNAGRIPVVLSTALGQAGVSLVSATAEVERQGRVWRITLGVRVLRVYADKDASTNGSRTKVYKIYRADFLGEAVSGEIVGSCFYQQSPLGETGDPMKRIFSETMTGVTFRRCNLDNVYVPPGNTIDNDCCHRRIRQQNDLMDWLVDSAGLPIRPIDEAAYIKLGVSIDPKDIPASPLDRPLLHTVEDAAELAARD